MARPLTLVRLEEILRLMSHTGNKPAETIKATPRVLVPTLLQCAILVFGFRALWRSYTQKHAKAGTLHDIQHTHADTAPGWMVDNPHIREGFRKKLSPYGCACSVGTWHNETINIWSHLFATLYFANAFVFCRRRLARWQALVAGYLFSMSTVAHCFCAAGPRASSCLFGVDRASIAAYFYSVSIFITRAHFPEGSTIQRAWLALTTIAGVLAMGVLGGIPVAPVVASSILICQMALGSMPVFRELLTTDNIYLQRVLAKYLSLAAVSGTIGAIAYTTRTPERYFSQFTRQLDFVGNSHNVMHVAVGMATFFAYRGSFLWELELQRQGKILGK